MKNTNAASSTISSTILGMTFYHFSLRSICVGLAALLFTVFVLFQNGGRIVQADTNFGSMMAETDRFITMFDLPPTDDDTEAVFATKTWDGGGVTNNWSEAANWSGDTVPLTSDSVVFDATSVKNATIDVNVTVAGWQIANGYTGTISQGAVTVTLNGSFSQSGGTFTGSGSLLDFNQSFTQSGGTFTASSGNTSFASSLSLTGGTFNHNGGTVVLDGSSGLTLSATLNLNNLNVNGNGTFQTNSTIIVPGTLTLTNGAVSNGSGSGTINATGNVAIASTYDGGNSNVLIDGAATRTVTLPAGAVIPRITVNSANVWLDTSGSGTVTFQSTVDLLNMAGFTYSTNLAFQSAFSYGTSAAMSGNGNITVGLFTSFTQSNGTIALLGISTFTANASTFTQTGGTFTGGSGVIDLNSTFTQSGGTFTASSTTTSFAANISQTGGTFNHNGGTVVFDGNSALTLPATFNLNNLTINGSSNAFQTNSTLIVAGTLTLTNGSVSNSTGSITGIINALGNVSIASTYDGGNSNVLIDGAATRTVIFPAGAVLPRLTVNSANVTLDTSGSGTVTFQSTVDLQNMAGFTYSTNLTFQGVCTYSTSAATSGSGNISIGIFTNFTQTNGIITLLGSSTFTVNSGTFTQSGGTFTGGSGLIDFNGVFTKSGGNFTASSTTTAFAASFSDTGGTFNHNGGTVLLDGSSGAGLTLQSTLNLNNLTINKSSGAVIVDTNSTVIVAGTLLLTDGQIASNTGTGTFNAVGNATIGATFDGGSANLLFSGAANQNLSISGGINPTGVWTINKSGGTVTLNNDLNLGNGSGNMVLTDGTLTTGTNTVITGTRTITRTNGFINGNLRRSFSAASSRLFDVGTAGGYASVTINATAGTFPATFTVGGNDGTLAGANPAQSLTRNWTLTSGGVSTANVTFKYLQTDVPGGANESGFSFLRRSGGTTTNEGVTSIDTTANTATLNGVMTFSDWSLGALPPAPTNTSTTTPTNTPTNTSTSTATSTATDTPTSTATDTSTPTATATDTPTATATDTPTPTATNTPTPTPLAVITGIITYGNSLVPVPDTRYVPDVLVSAAGSPMVMDTTGSSGSYLLTGFGAGSYTITPSKSGGQNGAITSFDAARVAQYAVGAISLTTAQQIVGDVTGVGGVTSYDAAYIARYAASLPPPVGTTGTWIFDPLSNTHASITSDINGEDYSALLMGDVSGNWANTGARAAERVVGGQLSVVSEDYSSVGKPITVAVQSVVTADMEIVVPVMVQDVSDKGVISYEFDVRYDPSVIQPLVEPVEVAGTASRALSFVANVTESGVLRVVVYGAKPIEETGVLLNLKFAVVGTPGSISPLIFERIMFNEGAPRVAVTNGLIEISR